MCQVYGLISTVRMISTLKSAQFNILLRIKPSHCKGETVHLVGTRKDRSFDAQFSIRRCLRTCPRVKNDGVDESLDASGLKDRL